MQTTTPIAPAAAPDLTLWIRRKQPRDRVPGIWASGRIGPFEFEALVFPEHASSLDYELAGSRISKLYLTLPDASRPVFDWDRGPGTPAQTPAAAAAVDALCATLAARVFGR